MFKLHIFNPEHDTVLGNNNPHYIIAKSARVTRQALSHLPAFWADDGDWVLVNDVENASHKLQEESRSHANVRFVTLQTLSCLNADNIPSEILPWGWDHHLVRSLLRANSLFASLVPTDEQLLTISDLSSRVFVAENILSPLVAIDNLLVGEMDVFRGNINDLATILVTRGKVIVKSPWSCSGRGVRLLSDRMSHSESGWCRNVLAEQGCLLIEPYYNNVLDFAMEFEATRNNGCRYLGLNIFHATNGNFVENVIDTEDNKRTMIAKYISTNLLDKVKAQILSLTTFCYKGKYHGPFGVDMMVVSTDSGYRVHPCVEINLRRTMGHVALL